MRYAIGAMTVYLLAGCSGVPPKPPTFTGDYRPVNQPVQVKKSASAQPVIPDVFDFAFEGDIVNSLTALRAVQPQLNVMPPLGQVSPLPVRITLRGTTLENALRAIGQQGGDVADVVWNTTKQQGVNQVFVRFRAPHKRPANAKGAFTVKPEKRPAAAN